MRALVTGVGGFVGRTIARDLLDIGHQVVGLARNLAGKTFSARLQDAATLIDGSVDDSGTMLRAAEGCDVIFHCAALVGAHNYVQRPVETMEIETRGLRCVCSAALRHHAKVIYLSSSAVYGHLHPHGPIAEDMIVAPVSSYGVAKRYNELYLAAQYSEHGLCSAVLRIFNVYGPGQADCMVVPRFIKLALAGEALHLYGGGQQTRDFVHVDDVARAATLCAELRSSFDIFNIATGVETSVRALAEKCIEATGSHSTIIEEATPAQRLAVEIDRSVGSPEHLQRQTGYKPGISLEAGLRTCLARGAL